MDIFQIACIAIVTTVLVLLLQSRPELAMMVGLAGGVLILLQVLPYIANIVQAIEEVAQLAGIEMQYIGTVLKATGIAVLITVCSAVCTVSYTHLDVYKRQLLLSPFKASSCDSL